MESSIDCELCQIYPACLQKYRLNRYSLEMTYNIYKCIRYIVLMATNVLVNHHNIQDIIPETFYLECFLNLNYLEKIEVLSCPA